MLSPAKRGFSKSHPAGMVRFSRFSSARGLKRKQHYTAATICPASSLLRVTRERKVRKTHFPGHPWQQRAPQRKVNSSGCPVARLLLPRCSEQKMSLCLLQRTYCPFHTVRFSMQMLLNKYVSFSIYIRFWVKVAIFELLIPPEYISELLITPHTPQQMDFSQTFRPCWHKI